MNAVSSGAGIAERLLSSSVFVNCRRSSGESWLSAVAQAIRRSRPMRRPLKHPRSSSAWLRKTIILSGGSSRKSGWPIAAPIANRNCSNCPNASVADFRPLSLIASNDPSRALIHLGSAAYALKASASSTANLNISLEYRPSDRILRAVLLEFVVQRLQADPQDLRRPRFVVARVFERPQDQIFLGFTHRCPDRNPHSIGVSRGSIGRWRSRARRRRCRHRCRNCGSLRLQIHRQVLQFHRAFSRENHGALERVPQLPDIPRPVMALKSFDDFRRKPGHPRIVLPVQIRQQAFRDRRNIFLEL